jgi:uncharacterized repeat protein (TIGR01451 family)
VSALQALDGGLTTANGATWPPISSLAPGASMTVHLKATLVLGFPSGTTTLTNTVVATSPDETTCPNCAPAPPTTTVTLTVDCNMTGYTTFTQGGWGSKPSGGNPGALLVANFGAVYPSGVLIGGGYTLRFSSAAAVAAFLPAGGPASSLLANGVNATNSGAGVFAGQVLALQLSVDFSRAGVDKRGLDSLILVSGPLSGYTVGQVLALANAVLGGNTAVLPVGMKISDLNNVVDQLNQNFDGGTTNKNYVRAPNCGTSAPGLQIAKVVDKSIASAGDVLTYTLNYFNSGKVGATNVVISDPVPAHTTFLSASNSGVSTGGSVSWSVGAIAAGASGTVTFKVTLDPVFPVGTTTVSNSAIVKSTEIPSPVPSNVVTTAVSGSSTAACSIGYPFVSSNPRTNIAFNENDILRGFMRATATDGTETIRLWYSDEHGMALGARQVSIKTASGTTVQTYPLSAMLMNPGSAINPAFGATAAQGGVDPAGRPLYPSLFITDVTGNSTDVSGDWQSGGSPVGPHAVFGVWKGMVVAIDQTGSSPVTTITVDADSTANGWALGSGSDAPPAGLTNEGYGAEARWNVNDLRINGQPLQTGHTYRVQLIVHDGDQNKTGGDAGEGCLTFTKGDGLSSMPSSKGYTTFTQGGWGSTPTGNNPGSVLAADFPVVYPMGLAIGGSKTLKFLSADAIDNFLPAGGGAAALNASAVNPTTSSAGVLAGQELELQLSVDFSTAGIFRGGLASLKVQSGKLAGLTVGQVATMANAVLGGNSSVLPSGVSIGDLNNTIDSINSNFDGGTTDKGYLK